jgi:hypothetical protein
MLDVWILPHNICVTIRNIYLKFEVDTLKSKEVIIFLKKILSSKRDKSVNIASRVMNIVT